MLIENPEVLAVLKKIVFRISYDPSWRDDLMQEALVHLWKTEAQWPHHTVSWYLQSCRYHLLNHLAAGRSVDSEKRRQGREEVETALETDEVAALFSMSEATVWSEVSAQDMMRALSRRLPPVAREILAGLNQGLGAREIARKLDVSHKTVAKHRRRIADQARMLGIASEAPPPEPLRKRVSATSSAFAPCRRMARVNAALAESVPS